MQNPRGDFVSKRRRPERESGGRDFFIGCEKPGENGEKPEEIGRNRKK